jgi:hypothetical protein
MTKELTEEEKDHLNITAIAIVNTTLEQTGGDPNKAVLCLVVSLVNTMIHGSIMEAQACLKQPIEISDELGSSIESDITDVIYEWSSKLRELNGIPNGKTQT